MKKNFNFVFILLLIALILFSLYKYIFTIKEGKSSKSSKSSKSPPPPPPPPPPPREVIDKLNRLFDFKNLDRNEILKRARELIKYLDDNNGKYAGDWYTVNYR
jgi:hypothetical protein